MKKMTSLVEIGKNKLHKSPTFHIDFLLTQGSNSRPMIMGGEVPPLQHNTHNSCGYLNQNVYA